MPNRNVIAYRTLIFFTNSLLLTLTKSMGIRIQYNQKKFNNVSDPDPSTKEKV